MIPTWRSSLGFLAPDLFGQPVDLLLEGVGNLLRL